LVHEVSEARQVGTSRYVRDVSLVDGSKASDVQPLASQASDAASAKHLVCPKVSVYYSRAGLSDPEWIGSLIAGATKAHPFHFFGLQAHTPKPGEYKIETMRCWYKIMPASGPKATSLIETFASISVSFSTTVPMTLETKFQPLEESEDSHAQSEGTETFCSHLSQMSHTTGLDILDGEVTVWQCNWTFPSVVGKDVLRKDGAKLWMYVLLEDTSGAVTVRMGEKAALELSGLSTKEDFCRAVDEGDPVFPTLVSVKVSRKLKTLPGSGDAPSLAVNMQIVTGCAQDFALTRTQSALTLIPIMKSFKGLTSASLPATVAMLTSSKIYPFCVQYPGMEGQPCQKAWVLLKATTKSVLSEEPPYTATTYGVQDALDSEAPDTSAKFTLVSLGTKTNLSSLRLAPAHGKPAFALAVISSLAGNTFYAETVEIIQAGDVQRLATAMKQEMALAAVLR